MIARKIVELYMDDRLIQRYDIVLPYGPKPLNNYAFVAEAIARAIKHRLITRAELPSLVGCVQPVADWLATSRGGTARRKPAGASGG